MLLSGTGYEMQQLTGQTWRNFHTPPIFDPLRGWPSPNRPSSQKLEDGTIPRRKSLALLAQYWSVLDRQTDGKADGTAVSISRLHSWYAWLIIKHRCWKLTLLAWESEGVNSRTFPKMSGTAWMLWISFYTDRSRWKSITNLQISCKSVLVNDITPYCVCIAIMSRIGVHLCMSRHAFLNAGASAQIHKVKFSCMPNSTQQCFWEIMLNIIWASVTQMYNIQRNLITKFKF